MTERREIMEVHMERVLFCALLLITTTISGCARNGHSGSDTPEQTRINGLLRALGKGGIGKVEILQIPASVLTRARITPDMLERQYYTRVEIRDITQTTYYNDLLDAFKTLSVQPATDTSDLRWGVIFHSRNGGRVGAVYFNKQGLSGSVDNLPVSFRGDFFSWLEKTFSKCLQ
jgi:hypothetical protein